MNTMITATPCQHSVAQMQSRFLTILPRIQTHARVYHRHIGCRVKRADAIAETVGLSWTWFVRLIERGKRPEGFVSVLASFAAKAVRSGRRVCGQLKARDVLSERAQQKHGFAVGKLPDFSTLNTSPLAEALSDNTRSPVPDQVTFRLDFPRWKRRHHRRDRRLIADMLLGEKTKALARRHRISPARVSQLRREFHEDWRRFTEGDPIASA